MQISLDDNSNVSESFERDRNRVHAKLLMMKIPLILIFDSDLAALEAKINFFFFHFKIPY